MGVGLVRKGATGSVSHSQGTPTLALRDTYGATFSFIEQGQVTLVSSGSQPTTPTNFDLVFFSKSRAGKMIASVVGPSGIDYNLQNSFMGNTIIKWLPSATTNIQINPGAAGSGWGSGWTARNVTGAQTHPTKANTNAMASLNRALFSTTAAINTSSGLQSTNTIVWRGSATSLGGFFFFARFGMVTIGTGARVIIGLSVLNGTLTVEPSTINNTIAIIKDAADTTWQFLTRNTSTLTKRDTSVTVTANQVLDIYIHVKPNDNAATFELRNPVAGTLLYSQTLTVGMIDGTVFLYAHCQVQASAASLSALALNQIHIEADV